MKQDNNRGSFSGKLGYVLATAGSAVGLGNIWRFPYLAAKYGGGAFLLVYIILALTFGYTMIMSETAIGRMTGKSPVSAFASFSKKGWVRAGGWINAVIPMLIVPYYSVIGGWVCRYLWGYVSGGGDAMALEGAFEGFLGSPTATLVCFLVFAGMTMSVIFGGVQNGIEKVSRVMMPILTVLALVVVGFSVTRPGALAGVRYFLVPDFRNFSLMTVVSALGQMFYSLSIAMGILITFGSYTGRDVDIEQTTVQVEIFDTAIAVLAGLMVIPAVFAFSGGDAAALGKGPSLMFITLPRVFESMGGTWIGVLFFLLVLMAALTSSVSLALRGRAGLEPPEGRRAGEPHPRGAGRAVVPGLQRPVPHRAHGHGHPQLLRFPDQLRDDAHCRGNHHRADPAGDRHGESGAGDHALLRLPTPGGLPLRGEIPGAGHAGGDPGQLRLRCLRTDPHIMLTGQNEVCLPTSGDV